MWSTGTSKTTNLQLGTSLSPKTCWAGHFSRRLYHLYSFQNQKSVRHPRLLLLTHLQSVKDNRDPVSSTSLMSIHLVPAFFQALVTSYLIIITFLWKTVQLSSIQPPHCQNNHSNSQIPEGLHSIQDYQQFKPDPTSLHALPSSMCLCELNPIHTPEECSLMYVYVCTCRSPYLGILPSFFFWWIYTHPSNTGLRVTSTKKPPARLDAPL